MCLGAWIFVPPHSDFMGFRCSHSPVAVPVRSLCPASADEQTPATVSPASASPVGTSGIAPTSGATETDRSFPALLPSFLRRLKKWRFPTLAQMTETHSQQTIERTEWQSADYIPKTAGRAHSAVGAASDSPASRGGTPFEALLRGETSA